MTRRPLDSDTDSGSSALLLRLHRGAPEERAGSGEIDKETQTRFHRSDFWGKILTIQGKACLETKAVSGS